jgi:serine/threonine protein kinase
VVRRLGGGAYGTVYQVEKAGAFFALKVARHREQSRDERHTDERAQRELSCLLSLRHPHIARVWGHGRWPHPMEGYFYLVMDYVEGFTLAGWMEATRATAHEFVVLIDKVFGAVAYMHAQGIFHRDLKPGNIMVSASTGEPVVVDYGAAHFPVVPGPPLTDSRLPPGTPRYTTPEAERFEAEHRHDPAARYEFKVTDELYALGVTIYDMLTDPRPESDPHPLAVGSWAVAPAHEVNERVPVALSRFVSRLLELDPAKRPVSAEAARRDVAELCPLRAEEWMKPPLQALPPLAPADEARKAPPRKLLRRWPRARTLASAALGLSVLLVAGVYLGLRGGAPTRPQPPVPVAGQPSPRPSSSQPVPNPEKLLPVNTHPAPEDAVPSLCSQAEAPPRGTPQWRAWCACAGIVGTLAAAQAGCAGVPYKQSPTAECSDESITAMKKLGLRDGDQLELEVEITHPCIDLEGDTCCGFIPEAKPLCFQKLPFTVTSRVLKGHGDLVPGTLLAGYFRADQPDYLGTGIQQYWTEATLPDGSKYPICMNGGIDWYEHETCPGAKAVCSVAAPTITFSRNWHTR